MVRLEIIIVLLTVSVPIEGQQCTSSSYQRCLCASSTPYCPCQALTPTNSLNFSSSYYSHLLLVNGYGCRPCASNCLSCSSLTVCTICLGSFELNSGSCIACPINCQTCSNGVCSLCNPGYYLDYYTVCLVCPVAYSNVCTITQLISCLQGYWLDSNAANCIQCDPNCQLCSSTTKCTACNQGYYLANNYTCLPCRTQCLTCNDNNSCIICTNTSLYYNSTQAQCTTGQASFCLVYSNSTTCSQCDNSSYLISGICFTVPSDKLLTGCQQYSLLANGTIICRNCSVGYFNSSNGCVFGCSLLCNSCFGPHYGLCFSCKTGSYYYNMQCIPIYNINGGSVFQLFYTAPNNPSFFSSGSVLQAGGCLLEAGYGGTNKITFQLQGLQSYSVDLSWKVYLYSQNSINGSQAYTVTLNNSQFNKSWMVKAMNTPLPCGNGMADKNAVTISGVLLNNNTLTLSVETAKIVISELLIVGYRCGGIQGTQCLECTSTSVCTKCVNAAYYISGNTCLQSCPSAYFIRTASRTCYLNCPPTTFADYLNQQCLECNPPCTTCSSNTTCLTCITNYYLYGSLCLATCPSGYYPYLIRQTCELCLRPCLTCLSNMKCLSCVYGFFDNTTNSCVLTCTEGYFGDISNLSCSPCVSPCLTCSSYIGTQCLSCITGFIFYNFRCITACPNGYYNLSNSSICLACNYICNTCSGTATNCTSCHSGTYLVYNNCLSQCPPEYFSNPVQKLCTHCSTNCASCLSLSYCQICVNQTYLYSPNNTCLFTCPIYYYPTPGKCSTCQPPCLTCLSQLLCLSCSNLFLSNNSCVAVCPTSTYSHSSTMSCQSCNLSVCLQCYLSPNYCTKCQNGLILFGNNCISSCPSQFYNSGNSCYGCDPKCSTCLNFSFCLSCASGYFYQNNSCSKTCSSGYYLQQNQNSCIICPTGCLACISTNSSLLCTSCLTNLYLLEGACLDSCPSLYYSSNSVCFGCSLPCQKCTGDNACLSCSAGFGYYFKGNCLSACPMTYFINNTSLNCQICSSNCLNCQSTPTNCSLCNSTKFLQQNSCIDKCSQGYYSSTGSNVCRLCQYPCSNCSILPYNCTSCFNSSNILYHGQCFDACLSDYYFSNGGCYPCEEGCKNCANSTFCYGCQPNYYLTNLYSCTTNCPELFFGYNGMCRSCGYPCLTCKDSTTCLSCLIGYFYSGSCLWICPTSTFLNVTSSQCITCPSNCASCLSITQCLQCILGVLVNGTCQLDCPMGYYNYYSVCAPCMYGCLICNGTNTCSKCYIGILYQGLCVELCPTGWVEFESTQGGQCKRCVTGCLKCAIKPDLCLICESGLFLNVFTCVYSCPPGTYKDYSTSSCVTCTVPCLTCQNGYSCISCIYGYILYAQPSGSQCIQGPSCPNSYYLNLLTNQCVESCPIDLFTQPLVHTCSKPCPVTFVLLPSNNTCLQYCPIGMWIDQNHICRSDDPPLLPTFTCQTLVLRNLLIIDCVFNSAIANLASLTISNFTISGIIIDQIVIVNDHQFRLITTQEEGVTRSLFIAISLNYRYQLYSTNSSSHRLLQEQKGLPVQNTNFNIYLPLYFSFSSQQRRTGMQLMQISQSVCIGAIIFWFFALIKNINSTSLSFVLLLQWLHSISLTDTVLAANLGQFLQGFKYANLFWMTSAPNINNLWIIYNSYREQLWGIDNYFQFSTSILTSLCIIIIFILVFGVTYFLQWKFKPISIKQNIQSINKDEKEFSQQQQQPSLISNVPSKKNTKQQTDMLNNQNEKQKTSIDQNIKQKAQKLKSKQFKEECNNNVSGMNKSKLQQEDQESISKQKQEQQWQKIRFKIFFKSQIINNRFYYNYWLQSLLLTVSPISIALFCQFIASNYLSLFFSLLFLILYVAVLAKFVYVVCAGEKLYISTKFWFLMFSETLIFNGLAVISTTQIFIGVSILILFINIYVWGIIFNSKRSKQLKHFHQISQILRIIVLLELLIGYANTKSWDSETYYNYSWMSIATIICLIIFVAVHSAKQFINQEEISKKAKNVANDPNENRSQLNSDNKSKTKSNQQRNISESISVEEYQQRENENFFSEHQPISETQNSDDIIDFDRNSDFSRNRPPRQLIRYDKNLQKNN